MTTLTLDQTSVRARDIHLGRALLTVLAAVLFALGWLAGRAVTGAVAVTLWCAAAVALGWRDARPRTRAG